MSGKPNAEKEMRAGYEAIAERIEIEIGIPEGRVLDVGCNIGAGLSVFAHRWPTAVLYGVEPDKALAKRAFDRGVGYVYRTSLENIRLIEGLFSLVTMRHSLEHLPDRRAAIGQLWNALRHGGHIYVQVPIEPGGTKNQLHLSPFTSLDEARDAFPEFEEVYWGPQETVAEFIGRKP